MSIFKMPQGLFVKKSKKVRLEQNDLVTNYVKYKRLHKKNVHV